MKIKTEIQTILDDALLSLNIHSHDNKRRDNFGSEYIVYNIVSSPYIAYANNLPIMRMYHVDIKYYSSDKKLNYDRFAMIEAAMRKKGWIVFTPVMEAEPVNDGIVGAVIEFCKEQVI